MKKVLLTSAALIFAAAGFAQNTGKVVLAKELPMQMTKKSFADPNAPVVKRNLQTGTYYVPNGGLWSGFGLDGMGMGYSCYAVAPFTDYTFINMMSNPLSGKWSVNESEVEGDANGNFVGSYSAMGMYYAPTIANGNDKWNFGANNYYGVRQNAAFLNGIIITDSISCLYPTDDHAWTLSSNGSYYSNTSSWGSLSTDNMYGSGFYVKDGEEYASFAVSQAFPALTSPLYVEQYAVNGLSFTQPIAEGDTLWAYITSVDTTYNSQGLPVYLDGDEIYETLFATHIDTLDFQSTSSRNGKTVKIGKVLFSKRTVDDFGNEVIDPFVIPAGKPFVVVITGFQNDGIDFGPQALDIPDEDRMANDAVIQTYDFINKQPGYNVWYPGAALKGAFVGMFDGVDIPERGFFKEEPADINYNVLKISDDGQTCSTYKFEGTQNDLGAALVGTATSWFDEMENPNYEIMAPEDGKFDLSWITGIMVDNHYYDTWKGYNLVAFKALPLGDVKGRGVLLKVVGKGVSAKWIYVVQGDYTPEQVYDDYLANGGGGEDAIIDMTVDNASENAPVYNLSGVRVSKDTKGLLIKNGKKFFNK